MMSLRGKKPNALVYESSQSEKSQLKHLKRLVSDRLAALRCGVRLRRMIMNWESCKAAVGESKQA